VFDGYDGCDRGTFGHGPFATLFFGSVTLSLGNAFLFKSFFAFDDIIFDLVGMVSSFTLRFINGFTFFFFTLALANQRGVAELDCFFLSLLLVFNETRFGEGLLALFFLLGLKIGGVSSVALLTVAVFASDDVIVFGGFLHNNFVDASLSSAGDGSNAQIYFIFTSLTLITSSKIGLG